MEFPQLFGSYIIVRRLAIGGMAEIYLAKTAGLAGFEKHLVLKVIHPKFATDPEFIEMLVREAKLVVRLAHVNIAQVFDLGREGDRYYIAMEYVDGLDLYQLLRRLREKKARMPLEVATYVVSEVASGLNYAHKRKDETGAPLGIIHRDISPQNILLSQSGDVKIIDFGIAKARAYAQTTAVGIIKGKFSYMSPEQAQGETLDHRSDIFTVGVLFYELLTNRMLYDSDGARDALRLAKAARFLPPSTHRDDLPRDLEKIVLKTLARNRRARYQTGNELREALTTWLRNRAPGYGRHRLEQFIRETCGSDADDDVPLLNRREYEPQASVIFQREPDREDHSRAHQSTRQISTRRSEKAKPPPIPRDSRSDRERRADEATAAVRDQERDEIGAKNGSELMGDPEEFEETVDLFSAPTAIVQLPSVPTIDLYDQSGEAIEPGFFAPADGEVTDQTLDAELTTAQQAYAETREALAQHRREAEQAPGPVEEEPPLETRPSPGDTPMSPLAAAWRVGPGLVEDGLFAETGNSSHLHPPKVTKVPPADGRPPAVSDTGGAADTGPRAREPAWPRPLVPPTPSGARYRLALLVALVTASIAIGVVVLVIALREPSPSAETGAIHVTTTPVSGAEIVLDGRSVGGTTPALISGLEGDSRHEIRVRHSDYGEGVARGVRVVAGGEVELTIELPPLDEP